MKKIFALVATASLLFSCSQEDITSNIEKLPINISVGQQTRANDSTFENEDEVGIYVVNYDASTAGTLAASGNQVDNERFTYNNGAWTPDETIYWKDQSTAADFYAYYPYSESVNISAHPFSVMADQSTEDNFWASDFLWGKATNVTPTSAAVPIVTNHSLSKILLAIEPGNGFTEESWAAATKSVKICNVKTNATIDLASGVATATGDDGEIVPFLSVPTASGVKPSYKAMIVPQTIADKSKLIVVTVDGTEYVYRTGITFKANTQHRFVITVNKKGGNVDVTIGEWEMDENINEGNAEEEVTTAETITNNQIWYTSADETIVEPYDAEAFSANIVSNTYENGRGVITFDGDVTSIGKQAFQDCSKLTSVNIPNSVTSIGGSAFSNSSLTRVDISDLSAWCKIDFGNYQANPLWSGAKLYLNNNEITELIIPSDITEINDYAFTGCSSLTKVNIPDSVTSIGADVFWNCDSITSVNIPDSVTSIGDSAFDNCRSPRVDISDLSAWCKINFYNGTANPLWYDGRLYLNNNEITELTIPSDITEINDYAFTGCSSLTKVTIPDSVTEIGEDAFYCCDNLTSVTIPDNVTSIGESAFSCCSDLTSITIPNSIKSIERGTFSYCYNLTSITIPNSVISIGDDAFEFCNGLTNITIPNSVTSIGSKAFGYCSSLKSAIIPNSVTLIEYSAFCGCSSLTSVTLPNSITMIKASTFSDCSSLTSITIPNSVKRILQSAFSGCSSLKEIYCKPTTPPDLFSSDTFANNASNRKIYVPSSYVDEYKSAYYWSDYADCIVGYDF